MGLAAGEQGAVDGYEQVPLRPDLTLVPQQAGAMFRRRAPQPTRRGVLHIQTARDATVAPDLARWFTERGFDFYVNELHWPGGGLRAWPRRGETLRAALADLDARCEQLRGTDGIGYVLVTAHGEGAVAAALWCAAQRAGRQADALILYTPSFGGNLKQPLDISCPVLVLGGPAAPADHRSRRRRPDPEAAVSLGRHVTWLRPTDGEARPDAEDPADRARFFDEMGRWLGAYMYGKVRDQLL
jgi:alpha-beta hydrolase superfamily lysophospholipase